MSFKSFEDAVMKTNTRKRTCSCDLPVKVVAIRGSPPWGRCLPGAHPCATIFEMEGGKDRLIRLH